MKRILHAAVLSAALLLAACASLGPYHTVWKNPGARPLALGQMKIAVVYMRRDAGRRLAVERQVADELSARGISAVPAEPLISAHALSDVRDMESRLRSAGVQAVLIIRVLDHPPPPGPPPYTRVPLRLQYLQLSQMWGYGWGRVFEPGYLMHDRLLTIETLLYSLPRDYLLWAGRSNAVLLSQIPHVMQHLGTATASDMLNTGLLVNRGA